MSNPSYQFLVPINPDFYRNLDNLRDLVTDTAELQSLIANVFVIPFDPFGSSENEEEEESTENQYRRFYSAVHRRYMLTDEGMCTIVLTAIVCDIDTSSGQWVIRSVSLLSLFERASLSSCTA